MVLIIFAYSNFYRLFLFLVWLIASSYPCPFSFIFFKNLISLLDFLSQKPHLLYFSPSLHPQSFNYIPYFTAPSLQKENKELLT